MQKLFIFTFLILIFPFQLFSNDEPTLYQKDMNQIVQDPIPNYLQPWWNNVETGKFAVIYIDFPDGRYVNGNDILQPFTNEQLKWVADNGL